MISDKKSPWQAGAGILSEAYTGAKMGGTLGGPWGALAGGILGGMNGMYNNWDSISGFFGGSSSDDENLSSVSDDSRDKIDDSGDKRRGLSGSALDEAIHRDAVDFHRGRKSRNPYGRVTSSMLLSGGYIR